MLDARVDALACQMLPHVKVAVPLLAVADLFLLVAAAAFAPPLATALPTVNWSSNYYKSMYCKICPLY